MQTPSLKTVVNFINHQCEKLAETRILNYLERKVTPLLDKFPTFHPIAKISFIFVMFSWVPGAIVIAIINGKKVISETFENKLVSMMLKNTLNNLKEALKTNERLGQQLISSNQQVRSLQTNVRSLQNLNQSLRDQSIVLNHLNFGLMGVFIKVNKNLTL